MPSPSTTLAAARPGWWIRGAHLQTLWARLSRSRHLIQFEREVLATPDGDEVMLDHTKGAPAGAPRVLLLHGTEGSAYSLHTQGLAVLVARAGWHATVLNFRSCARDPNNIYKRLRNKRPRLYHAGDTDDLALTVRTLTARAPETPLAAIGFSLGGGALLKWLAESDDAGAVRAAATISVPYDLAASADFLDRPTRLARFYVWNFMRRIRPKVLDVMDRFPDETRHLDRVRIEAARGIREFDDRATAPLHGFAGADDYYARASALPLLPRVRTPTLCVSATDDPFIPAESVRRAHAAVSPAITFAELPWGGHTGFVSGAWPWRATYPAEDAVVEWVARFV
ncbi:MAG TPA: alpha/beta fold hydrolase [Polyangia bacterium]|nr:alpha/beta fold hydrolase [Polyangia bacterium]